jgi:hypothetical protein
MNPSVMTLPAPLRAGHGPQMKIIDQEAKSPEVDI